MKNYFNIAVTFFALSFAFCFRYIISHDILFFIYNIMKFSVFSHVEYRLSYIDIDIDEDFELYAFLKNKKQTH